MIIREAGGKVLTLRGQEAPFISSTILAGTPALVDQLHEAFVQLDPELLG